MFHVKQIIEYIKKAEITELLFYGFIISLPFQLRLILNPDQAYISYYFSYPLAIFLYASDILAITLFVSCLFFKRSVFAGFWYIIPLILANSLLMFHVEQKELWLYGIVKLIEIWFLIVFVKNSSQPKNRAIWLLICIGVVEAIIAVLQFHVKHDLGLRFLGEYLPPITETSGAATIPTAQGLILRAYGTMPHPNVLGGFLSLILGLFFYVSRGTKLRFWNGSIFIILSCGLLVSFSRSAWAAAIVLSMAFIAYQIYIKAYRLAIIWFIFLTVSCGTLLLIYRPIVFPRIQDLSTNSSSVAYREEFNGYAKQAIKRNPWLGLGAGQYIPYIVKHETLNPWEYQPPHNIFLMFRVQFGIIGAILFIYALYSIGFTWNIFKHPIFWFIVPALLILGLSDHYLITIQQGRLLLAIALGLLISKKDVSQIRETS